MFIFSWHCSLLFLDYSIIGHIRIWYEGTGLHPLPFFTPTTDSLSCPAPMMLSGVTWAQCWYGLPLSFLSTILITCLFSLPTPEVRTLIISPNLEQCNCSIRNMVVIVNAKSCGFVLSIAWSGSHWGWKSKYLTTGFTIVLYISFSIEIIMKL